MQTKIKDIKKSVVLSISLCFSLFSLAQSNTFGVSFGCGYGYYDLGLFKNYFQSIANQQDFDARVVDNFPSNVNYFASFEHKTNLGFSIGPVFSYYSTGGRIHYSDYSGEYYNNVVLVSKSIGLQVFVPLTNSTKFIPEVYGKLSSIVVNGNSNGANIVYDINETVWDNDFWGGNTGFEFGISYRNIITKHIYLGLFVGYELTNSIGLHSYNSSIEWSGFRNGVFLSITI